jgi:hypothetical protein
MTPDDFRRLGDVDLITASRVLRALLRAYERATGQQVLEVVLCVEV